MQGVENSEAKWMAGSRLTPAKVPMHSNLSGYMCATDQLIPEMIALTQLGITSFLVVRPELVLRWRGTSHKMLFELAVQGVRFDRPGAFSDGGSWKLVGNPSTGDI